MKFRTTFTVCTLGLCYFYLGSAMACIDPSISMERFRIIGVASTLSGEILYSEELVKTPNETGGSLAVDYRKPNGEPLAFKIADYRCNPTTPSFVLEDRTSGRKEGVQWNQSDLVSFQGDSTTTLAQPEGPAVVDAGFDNVIKLNWDILLAGNRVTYDYLFARRNRFLKLRFSRADIPQKIAPRIDKRAVFFKVGANNLLFRLLSSPIYVGYDPETRDLLYYYGPTNLPMLDMEQPILISYQRMPV